MLRAVAEAARAFGRDDYRALAVKNGEFLLREMVRDGRVLRSHKDGVTRLAGYLEDHAAVALGALALYELTFERRWLDAARTLADAVVRWFWSDELAAFYDTASDHEQLVTRPREVTDNAVPAGGSLAVELLLRLAELFDDAELRRRATAALESLAEPLARHPIAFGHLLGAADMMINGAVELAIVGDRNADDFGALAAEAATHYLPALALAGGAPGADDDVALLRDRPAQGGRATAYLFRQYACEAPVTEPAALGEQLERAAGAAPTPAGSA